MILMYLTIDGSDYEVRETERSFGSKVPVKFETASVRMFFNTGDTEFGVIDVTTAGPALIVKV